MPTSELRELDAGLSLPQRWAIARARAQRTLARLRTKWDESEHPREPAGSSEGGQFTSGGGGGDKPEAGAATLDPQVTNVGGDEWNRAAAERLEREYQAAAPKVEKLAIEAPGKVGTRVPSDDEEEEEAPFIPEDWDQLTTTDQENAFEQFKSQNEQAYLDSEIQSWQDSGSALDDGKAIVTEEFNSGDNTDWANDAIDEFRDDFDGEIPYTNQQLIDAIKLDYETGYEGQGKFTVEFDDNKLKQPAGYIPPDPAQLPLPGIEIPEPKPEKALTQEMRDGLTAAITVEFTDTAQNKAESIEPPEYLKESAIEFLEMSWGEKSDNEKFEWTKQFTDIVESESDGSPEAVTNEEIKVEALPTKYDPLNEGSDHNYRRTQALAKHLSIARTREVLDERLPDVPSPSDDVLASIDKKLWGAWKSSSTAPDGMLLQVATADELGGRLNTKTAKEIDRDEMIKYAEGRYAQIGGYAGVKAYIRAKWEVSQYLLDKAGIKELKLYRGISLDSEIINKLFKAMQDAKVVNGHTQLPTLEVKRNGAASTSVADHVSNGWGSSPSRVVLRASVPRTAVISIPAYGINVHSEREVVVAGTAWKGWDAWKGSAPKFEDVPLRHAA